MHVPTEICIVYACDGLVKNSCLNLFPKIQDNDQLEFSNLISSYRNSQGIFIFYFLRCSQDIGINFKINSHKINPIRKESDREIRLKDKKKKDIAIKNN